MVFVFSFFNTGSSGFNIVGMLLNVLGGCVLNNFSGCEVCSF